jgi:N-acetylglucosamine kinase-like BadF-type ATPase
VDAAANSDAAARDILNKAAQELAYAAGAVRSQLWKPGEPVDIAYAGGSFRSATLRERFQMLVELESGNRCGPVLREPAEGALLEALRAKSPLAG